MISSIIGMDVDLLVIWKFELLIIIKRIGLDSKQLD
jgi:hypothetical protein